MQQDELLSDIQALIVDLTERGATEDEIRAQFENAIRAEF